jgi:hypothetical protein
MEGTAPADEATSLPAGSTYVPDATAMSDLLDPSHVIQLVHDVSKDWFLAKSAKGSAQAEAAARYNDRYPLVVRNTLAFYASETTHAWAAIGLDGTVTTSAPSVWPKTLWPNAKDVWTGAENLYALAKRFLDAEGVFYVCLELAAIQGDLLTLVDRNPTAQQAETAVDQTRKRIETARSNFRVGALTRATSRYLQGMLLGLGVTAPMAIVFGIAFGILLPWNDLVLFAVASAIAGQFGALVSVLTRISGTGLDLDYRAGDRMLRVVGFARPVLGAIFASALYFATVGGLVPLEAPAEEVTRFAFFIGIGFIAGFSERYAQDMLSVSPREDAAQPAPETAQA